MKSKIVFVAHAMSNPKQDHKTVLEILITLQNQDIIAVAPYLNAYIYGSLTKNNPNEVTNVEKMNTSYIISKFCDELWLYGDELTDGMVALISLADHVAQIPIQVKSERLREILIKERMFNALFSQYDEEE